MNDGAILFKKLTYPINNSLADMLYFNRISKVPAIMMITFWFYKTCMINKKLIHYGLGI
jgi:hypothetical protein